MSAAEPKPQNMRDQLGELFPTMVLLVVCTAIVGAMFMVGPAHATSVVAATCIHPSGGSPIDAVAERRIETPGIVWGEDDDRIESYSFVRNGSLVTFDTSRYDSMSYASWDCSPDDRAIAESVERHARRRLASMKT